MSNELDPMDQQRLVILASEINAIKEQTARTMMQAAVDIGRRLVEAKAAVGHGNWEHWLKTNVNYSQRTAINLINVYQEYGQGQQTLFGKQMNPQALANMTITQAVALLGIKDPDERADFVEEHDIDSMSTRQLQQAIKERDAAIHGKDAAEEALKALDRAVENAQKEVSEASARQKQAEAEKEQTAQQLAEAREKLARLEQEQAEREQEPVGGYEENDEAAHNLEIQLAVAKGRIKELEIQLEDGENEGDDGSFQDTMDALDVKDKQIKELQDQLQQAKEKPPADDTAEHDRERRLKFNIEEIQAKFNDSMEIIDAMDMDKQARFSAGIAKLFGLMAQKADGDDEQGGQN